MRKLLTISLMINVILLIHCMIDSDVKKELSKEYHKLKNKPCINNIDINFKG